MSWTLDEELTPRAIVEELDRYIIGQRAAKRAVAVALRDRWRRQRVEGPLRDEITPRNIIMIGPTGVGKTALARRLAHIAGAPMIKVEASKFTEVGYVGRDVESMVRDLVERAIELVRQEATARIAPRVRALAEDVLLEQLQHLASERPPLDEEDSAPRAFVVGDDGVAQRGAQTMTPRELLRLRLRRGELDFEQVELEREEAHNPLRRSVEIGGEQVQLGSIFDGMFPGKRRTLRMSVREARLTLEEEETRRLIDMDRIRRDALERVEQCGIIFLDEIDKIATRESRQGPDVSREGVQRDLLPIIEGSTVSTRHGVVRTDHILFIAAGAFHVSRPEDLIPELQGRFPVRVELDSLSREEFARILREPRNSLTRQYTALLDTEGVTLTFTDEALDLIADTAWHMNQRQENIGARRLHTIMERVFEDLSFTAPELCGQQVEISEAFVQRQLGDALSSDDVSRYVL